MRDLGFAFNDKDFSDRVLHVEIEPEFIDLTSDSEESDLDCDIELKENKNSNKRQKREEGEVVQRNNNSRCSSAVRVKTWHVNSVVLASKSPFFFKLFKNGMRESTERHLTLRINKSEEVALTDLLNYMYTNTLSASTIPELLSVLMAADKFEVVSCKRFCSKLLQKFPLSLEYAISYFELPSSVFLGQGCEALHKLRVDLKQYLVKSFKDLTKYEDKAMTLPLYAVEVVLGSDGLQVSSEDDVLRFILKWGRAHYPKIEERREILTKYLARFIYFPYISMSTLEEIQACDDFDSHEITKLVMKSLYSNSGFPYGHNIHLPTTTNTDCRFTNRVYKFLPIKAMPLDSPLGCPSCVVYFNVTKKTCWDLYKSENFQYSQRFDLGGRWFFLCLECKKKEHGRCELGLSVEMEMENETCTFDYEFAVLMHPSSGFQSLYKSDDTTLNGGGFVMVNNLLRIPAVILISDQNYGYFIESVLHLRAQLTIKN